MTKLSNQLPAVRTCAMEHKPFGPTGRMVSAIGQGTWYLEQSDHAAGIAALQRGLDLGMTHIDTAEMYGSGAAELLVGKAIAGRRQEIFLVSKVVPSNASRKGLEAACERSLTRLRTDRLDCYLLHWRGHVSLEDTIAGFEGLVAAGKILAWGVSNFDIPDLEEARAIAGDGRIACNQVLYNVEERTIEHAVLPWCQAHGVAVTAYSPFGHAQFVDPRTAGGGVLAEIADAHDATPRQVALAFLTRQPSVFAIPKASTRRHAEENAAASVLRLLPAEVARIDAAFPLGPRPRSLPML